MNNQTPGDRLGTKIEIPAGELTPERIKTTIENANDWFYQSGKLLTDTIKDELGNYMESYQDSFQRETKTKSEDIARYRNEAQQWKSNIQEIADKYPQDLGRSLIKSLDEFKDFDANQIVATLEQVRPKKNERR